MEVKILTSMHKKQSTKERLHEMARRTKLSHRGSKKLFTATARKSHRRNRSSLRAVRGGTRL